MVEYNEARSSGNTQLQNLKKLIGIIQRLDADRSLLPLDMFIEKIIQRTNYLGSIWKQNLVIFFCAFV